MTSNIGVRQLKDFGVGVGFATQTIQDNIDNISRGVIQKALQKTFSPEFLNRIDDVVVFNSLSKENLHVIIDIVLKNVYDRLEKLGFNIELSEKAKDFISEKGYDPQFGARPLHRAIQKYIEDPLAEEILNQNVQAGDTIIVNIDENQSEKLIFDIKKKKKKTAKEE
jgi:ATP-dependent Clp protease ATP-binding subunit ClpC